MTLNIFNDIWNNLLELSNKFTDFIVDNYNEPFLWITIFIILLLIGYLAISALGNK